MVPRSGILLPVLGAAILLHPAMAQFVQQGGKLTGTGVNGTTPPQQGFSSAISTDGNTVIIGAPFDNNNGGAAFVFTRNGGVWSQQGVKLVGAGGTADAQQGWSVALSGDGNTALVGGPFHNFQHGTAWVFTRTGGVWTQQGDKLVGTGVTGLDPEFQGWSVALSADGNTALVGGVNDNEGVGAVWVYTRAGGVWTQQGGKLVGTGVTGIFSSQQGTSVALSADGNTAIEGGNFDNSFTGAAWVFTRAGGVWTQQGNKLVGANGSADASQGSWVALSGDGNTALVGGPADNSKTGAAWVFTRTGGVWAQQGNKLVGTGPAGAAMQGQEVGLSADGNTALIGAPNDNTNVGAAWIFTRTGDAWNQQGNKLVGTGNVGGSSQGTSAALSGDGRTFVLGGPNDNQQAGAAWIFSSGAVNGSASLTVAVSHAGNFTQGQQGAQYTVTVSNAANSGPTTGAVTVTETAPVGLNLVSMAGNGWACGGAACSRSDTLAAGASYSPISVTVNVAPDAPTPVLNQVTVAGGGSAGASATDSTTIASRRCDLNGDGNVTVADVQSLVNMVLGLAQTTANADLNRDGQVNVADIQFLVIVTLGAVCAQ